MKLFINKINNYIKERKQLRRIERLFINLIRRKHLLRIIIGASKKSQKGWVMSEANFLNLLKEKDWKIYFKENSIKALLAEHVWEHLTKKQGKYAAKLCFKYLKKGGYIRIAVPDGFFPSKEYINHVKPGSVDPDASDHKILYNYKSLSGVFKEAGFKVRLLEYFDEKGSFHSKKWNTADGLIIRSRKFDKRNTKSKIGYTSLILDAQK